jgi:hypothetical protein
MKRFKWWRQLLGGLWVRISGVWHRTEFVKSPAAKWVHHPVKKGRKVHLTNPDIEAVEEYDY